MKRKIIPLFVMCLMCLTFLTGCSSLGYSYFLNADGTVSEVFSVTLTSSQMPEVDCDAFSQKIKQVADEWATEHSQQLSTQGVSCEGAKLEADGEIYTISIKIDYQSTKAYSNAWATDEEGSYTPQIERGWFQDKYIIYQGKTEFAGSLTSTVATKITTWLNDNYPTYLWQEKLSNIEGSYIRVYPNSVAPQIDENGVRFQLPASGYTVCAWMFDMQNPDFEITMYQNVVLAHNRANWFITALIITAICGVILYFALRTRKRKTGQEAVDAFVKAANKFAEEMQNSTDENANSADEKTENSEIKETTAVKFKAVKNESNQNKQSEDDILKKEEDLEALVQAPKKIRAKPKKSNISSDENTQNDNLDNNS